MKSYNYKILFNLIFVPNTFAVKIGFLNFITDKIFAQIHEKRLKPEVLKTSIDHYQLQCQLGFLISLGCIIGSLFSLVQS